MVNSLIARRDLDSEMTVVRNEMEMGENEPGRILFEMGGPEITPEIAKEAMHLAQYKLPVKTKFITLSDQEADALAASGQTAAVSDAQPFVIHCRLSARLRLLVWGG